MTTTIHKLVFRNAKPVVRRRKDYIGWILITTLLGLASRTYGAYLATFLSTYAGDILWATLVFWLVRVLFIRKPSHWVSTCALAFAFGIEVSQLYHAPWLDALRSTTLGSLVLGHGVLWSDLACYTVGVMLGCLTEQGLMLKRSQYVVELVEERETVH